MVSIKISSLSRTIIAKKKKALRNVEPFKEKCYTETKKPCCLRTIRLDKKILLLKSFLYFYDRIMFPFFLSFQK